MLGFKVRDGDPLSTAVGYTWVPLLEKGSLATGRHELPVTSELPPSGEIFSTQDQTLLLGEHAHLRKLLLGIIKDQGG